MPRNQGVRTFTREEIAEYNATHITHPKILAAQDKETRIIARRAKRESNAAHDAALQLETEMLHGQES